MKGEHRTTMFTDNKLLHYKTFGYMIMRSVFTTVEIDNMQKDFDIASEREDAIARHDG